MAVSPDLDPEPLRHPDGILPGDEVHVWQVDLKVWDEEAGSLVDLLNHEERERAARFKFPEHRNQFIISRALLRRALGRYLRIEPRQIQFRTAPNGKPELAANSDPHSADARIKDLPINDLRFNLSHTAGVTVFAVVHHRKVGVDVERIRDTNTMELAERFFSPPEVQWLRSQPASEHIPSFYACWTAKEAYIKAEGEGLSLPLSSFRVLPVPGDATSKLTLEVYGDPEESKRWSMWRLELGPDLRAALAVEGTNCKVRLGQWPSPAQDPEAL
jgi:4'-phosphopantetheinyl transferase